MVTSIKKLLTLLDFLVMVKKRGEKFLVLKIEVAVVVEEDKLEGASVAVTAVTTA